MFTMWCSKMTKAREVVVSALRDSPHAASVLCWLEEEQRTRITLDHVDFALTCMPPLLVATVLKRYLTPELYDRIIGVNVYRVPAVDFIPLARHIPLTCQRHRDLALVGMSGIHGACITPLPNGEWYLSCFIARASSPFSSTLVSDDVTFTLMCKGDGVAHVTLAGKGVSGAYVSELNASERVLRVFKRNYFTVPFVAPAHLLILPGACHACQ